MQGEKKYVRLVRIKTNIRERDRGYWVTNEYVLPDHPAVPQRLRGASITLRFDSTAAEDKQRGWSFTENLRIIDVMDEDFQPLYGIRNNAENVNRRLEDTLWAGRAHSVGIARQRIDHLGYAL